MGGRTRVQQRTLDALERFGKVRRCIGGIGGPHGGPRYIRVKDDLGL
jgi:hypothetical protein